MVSDAQKTASRKWAKENMTTLGCKVTKVKAEQFKEACRQLNTVPNQVLLQAVNDTIKQAEDQV